MRYSLRFLPVVEEDVISGYDWFEGKATGLGEDFLRIFYVNINEISLNPMLYPVVYKGFRRRLIRRFPYAIYYKVKDNEVIVFGLFHCARDPYFIRTSLKNRDE